MMRLSTGLHCGELCLLADVDVYDSLTDAALDVAAPVKPTATAFQRCRTERVVSTSAAQQLAAVRCKVARPL